MNLASTYQQVLENMKQIRILRNTVGSQYSSSKAYAVGDYCYYNELLYRCTTAIPSGGETWNISHWTQVITMDEITGLREAITYKPIEITEFSITNPSGGKVEKGTILNSVTLSYTFNKSSDKISLLRLDAINEGHRTEDITGQSSPYVYNHYINSTTEFELMAKDTGSFLHSFSTDIAFTTLQFLDKIYWGAAADTSSTPTNEFILGLSNNKLTNTKNGTYSSINATSNKYIWFAYPAAFGNAVFTVNGFSGGFSTKYTITFTNSNGYSTTYYVYRSDYPNLGNTIVTIS